MLLSSDSGIPMQNTTFKFEGNVVLKAKFQENI